MVKHSFLAAFSCLCFASVCAQSLDLDIHKNKLGHFLTMETALGSTPIANEANYISQNGVAQPILFERKEDVIPNLRCYYFYFQKDSTIDYVLYEWDVRNFDKDNDSIRISENETRAFIEKYKKLYDNISHTYGASNSTGSLDDISLIEKGTFEKGDSWKPDDSTKIELYLELSSKYETRGAITTPCVYRIRLYVYNTGGLTDQDGGNKPDAVKISKLDTILKGFLSKVKNGDFTDARGSLSEKINNAVTDQQLDGLKKYLQSKDSLVIFTSGIQIMSDGTTSLAIQYRFITDTSNPPMELLKAVFDEKDKIVIIQPVRRNQ